MNCFTHPSVPSTGICSVCGKQGCNTCLRDVPGQGLVCESCIEAARQQEVASAARRLSIVWWFTGTFAVLAFIGGLISIPQVGAVGLLGALLYPPLAFGLSWALFWGWIPTWQAFRRYSAGWGCFGGWMFLVIILCLIAEFLVTAAILYGAATGIQKYKKDKATVARAQLEATGVQHMPEQRTN